jgi:aspartate aminotransferase-like enzyme
MAARVRGWAKTNGLGLPGGGILERSPTLTPVLLPSGVAADRVRGGVRRRGIQVAAATGAYQASAVRIGHMGDIRMADVDRTLRALDDVLAETGHDLERRGVGGP